MPAFEITTIHPILNASHLQTKYYMDYVAEKVYHPNKTCSQTEMDYFLVYHEKKDIYHVILHSPDWSQVEAPLYKLQSGYVVRSTNTDMIDHHLTQYAIWGADNYIIVHEGESFTQYIKTLEYILKNEEFRKNDNFITEAQKIRDVGMKRLRNEPINVEEMQLLHDHAIITRVGNGYGYCKGRNEYRCQIRHPPTISEISTTTNLEDIDEDFVSTSVTSIDETDAGEKAPLASDDDDEENKEKLPTSDDEVDPDEVPETSDDEVKVDRDPLEKPFREHVRECDSQGRPYVGHGIDKDGKYILVDRKITPMSKRTYTLFDTNFRHGALPNVPLPNNLDKSAEDEAKDLKDSKDLKCCRDKTCSTVRQSHWAYAHLKPDTVNFDLKSVAADGKEFYTEKHPKPYSPALSKPYGVKAYDPVLSIAGQQFHMKARPYCPPDLSTETPPSKETDVWIIVSQADVRVCLTSTVVF